MRTRAFDVFEGSSKTLEYRVVDSSGNLVNAINAEAKLFDDNMNFISTIPVVSAGTGVFKLTINTGSLGLQEGKYIIEFSCVANGENYVRRDRLYVRVVW